jgi:hypothetical protein
MKKLVLVLAIAVALFGVSPARAFNPPPKCYQWTSCQTDPAPVPEPSGFLQLATGLFVVAGLALVARKRIAAQQAQ